MSVSHLVRGILLLGLAATVGWLFATGRMAMYMSPAVDPLTALTGVALGLLGVLELSSARRATTDRHAHPGASDAALSYLLVALPIGLGLLYSPRGLDAAALGGQAPSGYVLAYSPVRPEAVQSAPEPIPDIDNVFRFLRTAGEAGVGQPVRVLGMVARDGSLGEDEFVLLRYALVHCVADAQPVGLLVLSGQGSLPPGDSWVQIEGTLETSQRNGAHLVAVRAARIVPAEEPTSPYVQAF